VRWLNDTTGAPFYFAIFKNRDSRIGVTRRKEKMVLISFHIPKSYVEVLDELVRRGVYPSRSEAIRAALRELVNKYKLDGV
jgi:predicted solute-binding protein